MIDQSTPGPWDYVQVEHANPNLNGYFVRALGCPDGLKLVCRVLDSPEYSAEADARRIVTAVNAYDSLLEALQLVQANLDYLTNLWGDEGVTRSVQDKVRAALAKAAPEKGGDA